MTEKVFQNNMNIKDFLEKGYHKTKLSKQKAKELLEIIKEEHWVEVSKETKEKDQKARREYKKRYISKRSLFKPNDLREEYEKFLYEVKKYIEPITQNYDLKETQDTLTAFLGMPGYMMESHSDTGDRAVAIIMVYLSEEEFNDETGGQLQLSTVELDNEAKAKVYKNKEDIYPNNGVVVLINCNDPRYEHAVKEVKNKGPKRYSLFITIGVKDKNEWDYEFKEEKGKIETDKIYTLNDPKSNK